MSEKVKSLFGGRRSSDKDTSTTVPAKVPEKVADKNPETVNLSGPVLDTDNQLEPLPAGFDASKKHEKFKSFVPPSLPIYDNPSIFLAGSIEMGKAVQWQEHLQLFLQHLPLTVCNPRRGTWDEGLTEQDRKESLDFQIKWELDALKSVDLICFFFDHNTISPITLMELGLWAHSGKVVVCCDREYWRAGNVHTVCDTYNVPYTDSFKNLIPLIKYQLQEMGKLKFEPGEDVYLPPKITDPTVVFKPTQWSHTITQKAVSEKLARK